MVHYAMEAIETPLSVLNFEGQPTINPPGKLNRLKETKGDLSLPVGYSDYASLLQVCSNTKSLIMGKQVHSRMLITGQEKNIFLAAKLLTMYSGCGSLEDARQVFDKICEPNAGQGLDKVHNSYVFLWNGMIKGYAQGGACEEALGLYYQMRESGIQPDNYTFTLVLKVCAGQSALQEGMDIHDDVSRAGIELDVFVGTALLDMYAKCGSAEVARKLFDELPQRDQVSWNAMIAGYSQNGHAEESLNLFGAMRVAGVKPNPVTLDMLRMDRLVRRRCSFVKCDWQL
jgi:pentatricopeptide repeat protein